MTALFLEFWLRLRLWHSEMALSQINPLDPGANELVLEIRILNDQLDQLKGVA